MLMWLGYLSDVAPVVLHWGAFSGHSCRFKLGDLCSGVLQFKNEKLFTETDRVQRFAFNFSWV